MSKNMKLTPPQFPEHEVKQLAKQLYGLDHVSIKPLASELDLNFYIQDKTGREFVLKIAHSQLQRDKPGNETHDNASKNIKMSGSVSDA